LNTLVTCAESRRIQPNTDLSGYNCWLNKLNEFAGDFRQTEMVKAFLVSGEYRQRSGMKVLPSYEDRGDQIVTGH
jgi:hypothetical protein